MKIDIDKMTEEELIDLNHRVVERLRFLAQMQAHGAMLRFSIGQRVCFDPGDRPSVTGTLTKYNKKTVTVITDDGHRATLRRITPQRHSSPITSRGWLKRRRNHP